MKGLAALAHTLWRSATAHTNSELHVTNATFDGSQSPGDAEIAAAALCLRLTALQGSQALTISWDCLTPLRHVLHEVPTTYTPPTPAGPNGTPPAGLVSAASAPNATPERNQSLAHDSQMARIIALLNNRQADGKTTTFVHQKAHTSDRCLESLWPQALSTATAPAAYVFRGEELKALFAATQPAEQGPSNPSTPPHLPTTSHIHLVLNACADWAAKRVTLGNEAPCHHLSHSKWPPAAYAVATADGAYVNSEPNQLRRQIIARASQGVIENYVGTDARKQEKYSMRLHCSQPQPLWVAESTSALRMPCLYPERAAKFYLRYMTGLLAYNSERAAACPELLTARVHSQGPTMHTTCPLCLQANVHPPGQDTVHHVFHSCPATAVARSSLTTILMDALRAASHDAIPEADADAIVGEALSRDDYFAGQISTRTHQLLLASRERAPWRDSKGCLLAYTPGILHRSILKWAATLHAQRAALIRTACPDQPTGGPYATTHDVTAFQTALWQSKSKRTPSDTAPAASTTTKHQLGPAATAAPTPLIAGQLTCNTVIVMPAARAPHYQVPIVAMPVALTATTHQPHPTVVPVPALPPTPQWNGSTATSKSAARVLPNRAPIVASPARPPALPGAPSALAAPHAASKTPPHRAPVLTRPATTGAGPSQQHQAAGAPPARPTPHAGQRPPHSGVELAEICTTWNLAVGTTPGDGDCALHAASGLAKAPLHQAARLAANRAAQHLRTAVLAHARRQDPAYQTQAGTATWPEGEWATHASAARYDPTTSALVTASTYLPAALMPSLAACIQRDIIVLTRDGATSLIAPRPTIYLHSPRQSRTRQPALVSTTAQWRDLTASVTGRTSGTQPPRVLLFDGSTDPALGISMGHYTALLPPAQPAATAARQHAIPVLLPPLASAEAGHSATLPPPTPSLPTAPRLEAIPVPLPLPEATPILPAPTLTPAPALHAQHDPG
jgi:hypothetical protein